MKRICGILVGFISLWAEVPAGAAEAGAAIDHRDAALRKEQVHFLQCLTFVYDPSLWLSYEGNLYFRPQTEAQSRRLAEMKEARGQYAALTNRWERYELATRAIARSGISEHWRQKILLPYSTTQPDLTPTRDLAIRILPKYEVTRTSTGGDAILNADGSNCFVVEFGRAMSDFYGTNALLVRLGTKAFKAPAGNYLTLEAFANAGLSREEIEVFQRVAKACASEAAALASGQLPVTAPAASELGRAPDSTLSSLKEEFEIHQRRARDDSPYMQYLLAKDYLEGLGTAKDEKLGWEWMRRAAANGAGDARAYLQAHQAKRP